MKIGVIADPPTVTHSCAVVASQLAKHWVKQKHEVHYLGYNFLGEGFLHKDGYRIYKDLFPPTRMESVLRFINDTGVEILYAHGSKDIFSEGMKAATQCGIPYVPHTFYSTPVMHNKVTTFEGQVGYILQDCEAVDDICVCNNFSVGVGFGLGKRTWFVPNGVDADIFRKEGGNYRKQLNIPDDAFVVLFSGSNIPGKDPERALMAFAEFQKISGNYSSFLAMHTRPETTHADLRDCARKLGVESSVRFFTDYFAEWLSQPENYRLERTSPPYTTTPYELMGNVFRTGTALIAPTLMEGLSTTILEAQACGLPVICSDDPVVSEAIVNFSTGLLVHRNQEGECLINELADALAILHNHPPMRKSMGEKAEQLMHIRYNYEQIAQQFIYLFNAFISNRHVEATA